MVDLIPAGFVRGALAIPALGLIVLLTSLTSLAPAATFCVHAPPECVGTSQDTLQKAFDAAAANGAGRDEIKLGVGLFNDGPAINNVGNPVDLVGVASNKTAIRSTSAMGGLVILDIKEPTTVIRDLRVHHSSAAPTATGLALAGEAENVLVTNQGVAGQFDAVKLIGSSSSFEDSSVSLVYPENVQNRAIFVAVGASPTIADTYLEGTVGVADYGEATIRRTRIRAQQGVVAGGAADTTVNDTEIRTPGPMKSNFQQAALAAAGNGTTDLEVNRVTAYGDNTGYGVWVVPNGGAGNNATVTLGGTVLDNYAIDLRATESGGSNAAVTSVYSAYDSGKLSFGAGASHVQGVGKFDMAGVDPLFRDAGGGDFSILYNSPLVEAGDATYQPFLGGLDVRLLTRVRDGNGNGSPVVDIGAHEYQHRPPDAVASAPPAGNTGQALAFDGSQSSDPDEEALTHAWSFDGGPQVSGSMVQKAFDTPGAHTATLTVTDPTGLTDTATVTVTISAAPTPGPKGPGGGGPAAGALALSDLKLVPGRFRVAGARRGAAAAKKARRGTRIKFTLSQAAPVTFTVERARPKRRWKKAGTFVLQGASGANSLKWGGRIGKRALRPGRYRLSAQAAAAGLLSEPQQKRFKIAAG
jgi:hypothetical protein